MVKAKPIPCTKDEIDKILDVASKDEFYYLLFNLAKTTGRRLGELVGEPERIIDKEEMYQNFKGETKKRIIWKRTGKYVGGLLYRDIDWTSKKITLKVLKARGMDKNRDALLTDEVLRLLRNYCNHKQLKNDDYVLREKSYRAVQQAITRYAKEAGVPHKVSFHNFRHYFITEMLKRGISYDKIIKFTGHQSTAPLSAYDHVVPADLINEAMPIINNL